MADAYSEAADALYALAPGEFTAARNRAADQAKRSGDRELAERIRALRRPTAAAHALNLLVRAHPDQVKQLRELGKRLREAQAQLQGPKLRELASQRTALVHAFATQARREAAQAGQPVGDQAADELDQTLRAVLADETAAEDFAAGRLTRALTPGSVLPDPLTSAPPRPATRPSTPGKAEREAEKKRRLAEAEQERRRLEAEQRAAETALDRVRAHAEHAAEQARMSRERVQRAEQALDRAREALDAAEQKAASVRDEVTAAQRRAEQLRARLEERHDTVAHLQQGR